MVPNKNYNVCLDNSDSRHTHKKEFKIFLIDANIRKYYFTDTFYP